MKRHKTHTQLCNETADAALAGCFGILMVSGGIAALISWVVA